MIRNLTISALLLAAVSGTAFAASPTAGLNAGDVQLALSAGVEPGRYSRAELIAIIDARTANDDEKLGYFLSGSNREATTGNGIGWAQYAASLGVEPGEYTPAELQRLDRALAENDAEEIRFILSGAARTAPNPAEVVTPGEAQLAALIGVDPADYTLAELVALQPEPSN